MRHPDITGEQAIHQFAFLSDTDPADDPGNDVGPGKAWVNLSTGVLVWRALDNSGWNPVGGIT